MVAESKEGMPMIWHYDKRAEINSLLPNSERKSRNDDFARRLI